MNDATQQLVSQIERLGLASYPGWVAHLVNHRQICGARGRCEHRRGIMCTIWLENAVVMGLYGHRARWRIVASLGDHLITLRTVG